MKALVLAAGLGTRLRPLTEACAKPSLPVVGIPSLWYGAWHLRKELRILQFAVNMSHAPESIRIAGADRELKKFTGITFKYSDESVQLLGSSGALWRLKEWVASELLAVCNGDSICFPSWTRMANFHRDKKALLTMHVRQHSGSSEPYTNIVCDANGCVQSLAAKTDRGVMFTGNYLLEPELLQRLPEGVSELRPTLLEPLIAEGRLFAFREDLSWFDTGTIAAFVHAQFNLLKELPVARELIEIKMREEGRDCWVPRDWVVKSGKPALSGPVVLTGSQSEWAACGSLYGPRFIGITPPPAGMAIPRQNALVFLTHVEKL